MSGKLEIEDFRALLTGGPPELGMTPRPGVLDLDTLNTRLESLLKRTDLQGMAGELLHAVLLSWHDQFDAAHEIAQGIGNSSGSYLHGILHRREPDFGNARYWFHRAGQHPGFAAMAERMAGFLESKGEARFKARLLAQGRWSPTAFTGLCEEAHSGSRTPHEVSVLRAIQAIEHEVLFEGFLTGVV